jgi:aspartyl-tRNA(Asn)/glutamyl-tRNA(Gln) amidotransferase subunit A
MATDQDVQQTIVRGTMMPIHTGAIEKAIPDITIIHKRVRAQRVSPVEVVNACLERIEQLNPRLNAFITVLADQAREQARVAEAEIKAAKWRGPLHGIPVGIKDFYDTAGIKTTALPSEA